jgi:hypothetical protein
VGEGFGVDAKTSGAFFTAGESTTSVEGETGAVERIRRELLGVKRPARGARGMRAGFRALLGSFLWF